MAYNRFMNEGWTLLALLLVINGLIALSLSAYSWMRRQRPGQAAFAVLMLAAGIFSIFYGFEITTPTLGGKTLWLILENLGIVFLGPLWFLFAADFTLQKRFPIWKLALLFAIPTLTLTWFTFGLWPRFYYTTLTPFSLPFGPLLIERGLWYWVQMGYSYLLMIVGTILLVRSSLAQPDLYRSQVTIILLGVSIPWFANLYYLLLPLIFPQTQILFDPTPVAFTLSGLVYSVGVFGLRLFDLIPAARTAVFDDIPELVVVLDTQDRVVDINAAGQRWLKAPREEIIGRDARSVFKSWPSLVEEYIHVEEIHEEVHLPGNSPEYLDLTILPLRDHRGRIEGRMAMGRNITPRKQVDNQLRLQSAALDAAANAIVITDTQGICLWVNPAFSKITGYKFEEIVGQKLSILKSGLQDDLFYQSLWRVIMAGETWNGEIINRHKQGHLYIEEMSIAPVRDTEGRITHFIAVKQDITDRKRIENNLREAHQRLKVHVQEIEALQVKLGEQAIRDPLTGLFNRRYLEETLEREVARATREKSALCLAMIDVDHFKDFNDRHGHKAGDLVLQALGHMLADTTRAGDAACRYGGEEFVVIMPGATLEVAHKRAEEWRLAFQEISTSLPEYARTATISIGLACFPEHGLDSEALVDAADKALYRAKDSGRDRVIIYGAV